MLKRAVDRPVEELDGTGSRRGPQAENGLVGAWRRLAKTLRSAWHWCRRWALRAERRIPTELAYGQGGADPDPLPETEAGAEGALPAADPVEVESDGETPDGEERLRSLNGVPVSGETAPPGVPQGGQSTDASRKPFARGGERGLQHRSNEPSGSEAVRSRAAAKVGQVEIVCRKRGGRWELVVVPRRDVEVRGVDGQSALANHEFVPASFRGEVVIEDGVGGEGQQLRLYTDKPMVFRVGTDWRSPGRKVRGVGFGHFVANRLLPLAALLPPVRALPPPVRSSRCAEPRSPSSVLPSPPWRASRSVRSDPPLGLDLCQSRGHRSPRSGDGTMHFPRKRYQAVASAIAAWI